MADTKSTLSLKKPAVLAPDAKPAVKAPVDAGIRSGTDEFSRPLGGIAPRDLGPRF